MNKTVIKALAMLFEIGSCKKGIKEVDLLLLGLAYSSEDNKHWVISQRLLIIRTQLSNTNEAIAAILATNQDIRENWVNIIAARCKEAGKLSNASALVLLVTNLAGAAKWIEQAIDSASLKPSAIKEVERELLNVTAEQTQATPVIVRILAAASQLAQWQQDALPMLSSIDKTGTHPDTNWSQGRLLERALQHDANSNYILSGECDKELDAETMTWVLAKPWLFLLATIAFVQDSWAAETHGGLLLELPNGQHPHQPSEIQVLVSNNDGDEILCGTLAGFILKVLSRMNMGMFPSLLSEAELNNLLSPIIGLLLQRKVWRYQEGLSGEQGFYQIHPEFSDACYRISGARSFNLYGRPLRTAIREQAEQWRIDQQNSARANKEVAA